MLNDLDNIDTGRAPELRVSSLFASALMWVLGSVGAIAGSIEGAPLRFNGKVIENAQGDVSTLVWPIVQHYVQQVAPPPSPY